MPPFCSICFGRGTKPQRSPHAHSKAISTSSFSSMKFKPPSLGTKVAIFLPFLMSCTRQHLRMAEFGCLASMPTFSTTMTFHLGSS